MADPKKPGPSLEDLKARLGLDSVLTKANRPPDEHQTDGSAAAEADEARPEGVVGAAGVASPEAGAGEEAFDPKEYSAAVQTYEDVARGEGDPSPLRSAADFMIDPDLSTPISSSARWALIAAVSVGMALALSFGFGLGKVMRSRQVANQVIDEAAQMLRHIQPTADRLLAFQERLATIDDEYTPESHQVFIGAFEGPPPTVSAQQLADASILMTTGIDLTQDLLDYARDTQMFSELFSQHLIRTSHDMARIEALREEREQRAAQYAVYFDNMQLLGAHDTFLQNPVENLFRPPPARIVTYEHLEIVTEGEGEEARHFFTVTLPNGQEGPVRIYNLALLDAEQLFTSAGEENALDRYRARVRVIRERLNQLLTAQQALIQSLNERSAESRRFSL